MTAYDDLRARIAECHDLFCILNMLKWDMRAMMPAAGAASRGAQLATLSKLAKSIFISDETARLLDAAEAEIESADPDSYKARALRQTRDAYEIQRRIPAGLVGRMAALGPESEAVWARAKDENDFAAFKPYLQQMLALNIELAEAIGYADHPFDALIRQFEPGMTAAQLEVIFAELKARILPLLQRIVAADAPLPLDLWEAEYDLATQKSLCLEMAALIGFDFERGRLDSAPHPFEISFTRDDVRITTRYDANYLPMSLFAALHEAGHGLYEQNIAPELTRTALTADFLGQYAVGGASFGAHEFSSRLWENQIGRSREFWRLHFGRAQALFPEQLAAADAELFYRAVNRARPSLIRVEADEVTYNLHIMLRAEIEMALLEGAIAVDDLPEFWNAKMQDYLGLAPPDDRRGVLQDVHWSFGGFGNFPCYTIGNIMAAQALAAAQAQMPDLAARLAAGDYQTLLAWLTENFYRHGRAYGTDELLTRATGEGLNTAPLLDYLEGKYTDLYDLN
ncbi:MAG: carboxypeptidase M32 [Chloroflexota bacterium]|nr:carboxypeptidase M32 [Chloroflexota bacterium]MDE2908012.1 carboxypeptidase M32 [Chloroflexota bacterium]